MRALISLDMTFRELNTENLLSESFNKVDLTNKAMWNKCLSILFQGFILDRKLTIGVCSGSGVYIIHAGLTVFSYEGFVSMQRKRLIMDLSGRGLRMCLFSLYLLEMRFCIKWGNDEKNMSVEKSVVREN